ncbi:MAG: FtsL-like putative cell division protein [Alistipes indistinctus]
MAQVLSGNILTRAEVRRMYPSSCCFIAVLMFLYIANGYHIQKLHRRHDRISEQIKELRSRSLTLRRSRMTATRQSRDSSRNSRRA